MTGNRALQGERESDSTFLKKKQTATTQFFFTRLKCPQVEIRGKAISTAKQFLADVSPTRLPPFVAALSTVCAVAGGARCTVFRKQQRNQHFRLNFPQ